MRTVLISILLAFMPVVLDAVPAVKVRTGIEVLEGRGFEGLEGKRVGLVTNPSGVDRNLRSTIDILNEAENVNLVALFGPEHGVRGDAYARSQGVRCRNCPSQDIPNAERPSGPGYNYLR